MPSTKPSGLRGSPACLPPAGHGKSDLFSAPVRKARRNVRPRAGPGVPAPYTRSHARYTHAPPRHTAGPRRLHRTHEPPPPRAGATAPHTRLPEPHAWRAKPACTAARPRVRGPRPVVVARHRVPGAPAPTCTDFRHRRYGPPHRRAHPTRTSDTGGMDPQHRRAHPTGTPDTGCTDRLRRRVNRARHRHRHTQHGDICAHHRHPSRQHSTAARERLSLHSTHTGARLTDIARHASPARPPILPARLGRARLHSARESKPHLRDSP